MGLQLELLPYPYDNTLGFNPALIDYIDHIDDSFLLDIIDPLYSHNIMCRFEQFRRKGRW